MHSLHPSKLSPKKTYLSRKFRSPVSTVCKHPSDVYILPLRRTSCSRMHHSTNVIPLPEKKRKKKQKSYTPFVHLFCAPRLKCVNDKKTSFLSFFHIIFVIISSAHSLQSKHIHFWLHEARHNQNANKVYYMFIIKKNKNVGLFLS